MRQRPLPRRPPPPASNDDATVPETPSIAPVAIDAAVLLRGHLSASLAAAPVHDVPAATSSGDAIGQPWRDRLSEIGQSAGLSGDQESEFERLAHAQLERIRTEIPRLLEALKPHFDTPQEAEAKQRYESGLRALKAELDEETDAVLQRFGITPDTAQAASPV